METENTHTEPLLPTYQDLLDSPELYDSEVALQLAIKACNEVAQESKAKRSEGKELSRKEARALFLVYALNSAIQSIQKVEEMFLQMAEAAEKEETDQEKPSLLIPGRDF